MEQEVSWNIDLHAVKRVAEVRASAANDLLESGWVLHDIYFGSRDGEYVSNYVMLAVNEPSCPSCGANARVEVLDSGSRVRYICTDECSYTPVDFTPTPEECADRSV